MMKRRISKTTIAISTGIVDRSKWKELENFAYQEIKPFVHFIGCGAPMIRGSITPGVFSVSFYENGIALIDIKKAIEDAYPEVTVFLPEEVKETTNEE